MNNKPFVFRALDCEDDLINCPHEYSILVQICHYINRDAGYKAWLSQERIRKKCRLSQSTVVRKIKSLSDKGIIKITKRKNKTNLYEVPYFEISQRQLKNTNVSERHFKTFQTDTCSSVKVTPNRLSNKLDTNINYTNLFNEFWNAYPKKGGDKIITKKTYINCLKKNLFKQNEIIKILKKYQNEDITYLPFANKWLEQERYKNSNIYTNKNQDEELTPEKFKSLTNNRKKFYYKGMPDTTIQIEKWINEGKLNVHDLPY